MSLFRKDKRVEEVFGISNEVLMDSYVDRGELDEVIGRFLRRPLHIALRGESKCGKSWLRQRTMPNALTVQCRLGKTVEDIYVDALSQLDVRLTLEHRADHRFQGSIEALGEAGLKLLAKAGITLALEGERSGGRTERPVGRDINDLRFVADILKASDRRLVIEDFHYLSVEERRKFAFDLKALWDYGLFVVVIGVWSQSNLLMFLNPDLTGRMEEVSIYWSGEDLRRIMQKGGEALNLEFAEALQAGTVANCFGNAGILQALVVKILDATGVTKTVDKHAVMSDMDALETAALQYAEQLNPLYQQFARRVSSGIRTRKDSTGIYAHAMAVILEASDDSLISGLPLDQIFQVASEREPRIQKGNLRTVLERFEQLQVDDGGRGLIIAYNEATAEVSAVDRQLLLYRRYSTVKWPWEDLIAEARELAEDPSG